MITQNASAFIELVLRDPDLRQKVLAAAGKGDTGEVETIAQAVGLPATFAEISTAFREGSANTEGSGLAEAELSDLELEAVAGGQKLKFGGSSELAR